MNSNITIGKLTFNNLVNSVTIESSWKFMTQRATIRLPRLKKLLTEDKYKINVGDVVTINIGYDDRMRTEFTGYVSEVAPRSPIEIKCEDEMWKMKRDVVTKSWASVKLKDVILYLFPDADVSAVQDITLSNFRIDHVSRAKAMEKLKDETELAMYFRNGVLFCGLPYTETGLATVVYDFQKNISKDEGKKSLTFLTKESVKLKVRAISMLPDNKKLEVELGDEDGNTTTLHYYNIRTKDELQKLAAAKINKLKYDGYRGSFHSFGLPYATHGMIADLRDANYPERAGKYFIDEVVTQYDKSGFDREIKLGLKADSKLYE